LVIRKSSFVGVCLLTLAVSISLNEYVTYSPPVPVPWDDDRVADEDGVYEGQGSRDEDSASPASEDDSDAVSREKVTADDEGYEEAVGRDAQFPASGECKEIVRNGDTLASILGKFSFNKSDIHVASKAVSKIFNLKNLKKGGEVIIRGKKGEDGHLALEGLEIIPDYRAKIVVSKKGDKFSAKRVEIPLKKIAHSISGAMSPMSPSISLKQCGVKPQIANEAMRIIRQVVDVRSSNSPIDFEFLCNDFYDQHGNPVQKSELIYASVLTNGKIYKVYKFKDLGTTEYVDTNGVIVSSLAKAGACLGNPLDSMRVTSRFGMRVHPISGRFKYHTGIDFSARIGTPVRAAASGIVTRASYYSGYGKYIAIRHGNNVSTAYGHLSKIVVRNGQSVCKGQIIGYTGNTGYSHGPHLHYEVIECGRFVNPMSCVKQGPLRLTGKRLNRFNQFKREVSLQMVGLTQTPKKVQGKGRRYIS
jgi:murein DD-endopeptidase MepM/ murein hydrolase activator NlpD